METLGQYLKDFRIQHGLTIDDFINKYNTKFETSISKSMVSRWENDLAEPKIPVGRNIALMYGISFDELVGISSRNEIDIANILLELLEQIDSNKALKFDDEILKEETKEVLMASIQHTMQIAKILNKKK